MDALTLGVSAIFSPGKRLKSGGSMLLRPGLAKSVAQGLFGASGSLGSALASKEPEVP